MSIGNVTMRLAQQKIQNARLLERNDENDIFLPQLLVIAEESCERVRLLFQVSAEDQVIADLFEGILQGKQFQPFLF